MARFDDLTDDSFNDNFELNNTGNIQNVDNIRTTAVGTGAVAVGPDSQDNVIATNRSQAAGHDANFADHGSTALQNVDADQLAFGGGTAVGHNSGSFADHGSTSQQIANNQLGEGSQLSGHDSSADNRHFTNVEGNHGPVNLADDHSAALADQTDISDSGNAIDSFNEDRHDVHQHRTDHNVHEHTDIDDSFNHFDIDA